MVNTPRPAEASGLFLRYCLNWQRLLQMTVIIGAALLLVVHGALIAGLSGYVWLLSLIASYAATYLRDAPLHTPLPRDSTTVNVQHAFNLLAVVAGIVLRLSAFVSVMIWAIAEDMTRIAGYTGGVVLFLALIEQSVDVLFVEGARAFIVLTGQEAAFLSALWHLSVQNAPQTTDAWSLTPRRYFMVNATNGTTPQQVHIEEPRIILDE